MIFIIFLLVLLFPKTSFASDEFKLSQSIVYDVDTQGYAKVHQENNLVNNYSEIYIKEFQFNISGNELSNIHATDSQGSILQDVATQAQDTVIKVKFNEANLGKNKLTTFNLDYDIKNFAVKKGNTWEISLPQLNLKQNDDVSIELSVPQSFGSLSFASITPKNILVLNQKTRIYLDTHNLKDSKVLFVFGNSQIFDLNLKYYLENKSKNAVNTEIAIPPDTDSQHVIYHLTPLPKNVNTDNDGNWLAQYQLKPQEKNGGNSTRSSQGISSYLE